VSLNIKNAEVNRLAHEVASLAGESLTQAVRRALEERKARLLLGAEDSRLRRLRNLLENEIWPQIPPELRGTSLSREERESLLGYGPDGV